MTRNGLFRVALLLTLFSFTLAAGTFDLLTLAPTGILGDVNATTSYTSFTGNSYSAVRVIGGVWDGTSTAVDASDKGITGRNATPPPPLFFTTGALEAPLGVTIADLEALLLDPTFSIGIGNGSAAYWNVNAAAGDNVRADVNFVANDTEVFDDFAFLSVVGPGTHFIQLLNRIDVNQTGGVGMYADSGYYPINYNFAGAGAYTIGLGVVNVAPYGVDVNGDVLLTPVYFDFDVSSATYDPSAQMSDSALILGTPEPSTWLFAGSAVLIAGLLRRRRKAS